MSVPFLGYSHSGGRGKFIVMVFLEVIINEQPLYLFLESEAEPVCHERTIWGYTSEYCPPDSLEIEITDTMPECHEVTSWLGGTYESCTPHETIASYNAR